MNIVPVSSSFGNLTTTSSTARTGSVAELPFKDYLQQMLDNIEETTKVKNQDALNLATGDVDDLAMFGINSTKAELSVTMLVELRNTLLEAYQEVMRMNV